MKDETLLKTINVCLELADKLTEKEHKFLEDASDVLNLKLPLTQQEKSYISAISRRIT